MYSYNNEDKFYMLKEEKIFYQLLTGLSYRKIAEKYYTFQLNKFVYRVRKLMKELNLQNRRQLAYFAIKNHFVNRERLLEYLK